MWGLLGERGNWMGLRDSLFSWGSVWQSLCPALAFSDDRNTLFSQLQGPLRGLPGSRLLSPALAEPCPLHPTFLTYQRFSGWIMAFTGIFHSVHLDSTCPCPKLQSILGGPLQTETHPFLLTFAHAVLKGGGPWPNLPLNVRTALWISWILILGKKSQIFFLNFHSNSIGKNQSTSLCLPVVIQF